MGNIQPIIIGIAGGSASGKTTVTTTILDHLDPSTFSVFSHDSYYKDLAEFKGQRPEEINFDHPNALDTELLIEHVKNLKQGKSVDKPCYDFKSFRRLEQTEKVNPRPLIIVEGILIFSSEALRKLMDIKIYVDTDADERLTRRIRRDTLERGRALEAILDRYAESVKPMHMRFVEPSKRWADVIIPRGGGNFVAIDMVLSRIHKMLEAPYEGPGRRHTDKIIRKVIG
tara:strand:- start:70 stop:753 length:684 start_codon:yes stop_codon:yes gene_type:complete